MLNQGFKSSQIARETKLSQDTIDIIEQQQTGHPTYDKEIDPKQLKKENQLWKLAFFKHMGAACHGK